jgi:phage terminase large subunit
MRIEAVRRIMPKVLVSTKSRQSRAAMRLGYYHERKDENRNVGLGPDHDWSSHARMRLA